MLQKLPIHVSIEDFPSNVLLRCLSNATPNLSIPFHLEKGVHVLPSSHLHKEKYNVQFLNDMNAAGCMPDRYASGFCNVLVRHSGYVE
jgi:hypothetical protein